MDNFFCTHFNSNYQSFGLCLIESLLNHSPNSKIFVIAMDKDCYNSLREMNFSNVILIDSNKIEKFYPILKKAKNNR